MATWGLHKHSSSEREVSRSMTGRGRIKALLMLAMLTIALSAACRARAPEWASCSRPPQTGGYDAIHVSGVVEGVDSWGPPNFGGDPAHDRKITVLVLALDYPLTVVEDRELGTGTNSIVSRAQLHVTNPVLARALTKGRTHIRVAGTLRIGVAPAEITHIVIDVDEVDYVSQEGQNECAYRTNRQ